MDSLLEFTRTLVRAGRQDLTQYYRYGSRRPKFGELLFVNPANCLKRISSGNAPYLNYSGLVLEAPWPEQLETDLIVPGGKMASCYAHWVEGKTWSESGYLDAMLERIKNKGPEDGCSNKQDILRRCQKLDRLFEETRKQRCLKQQSELRILSFRERGGIYMSIDAQGNLVKTGGGNHRLLIAQILGLELIPVQVGIVHIEGIDAFLRLRKERDERLRLGDWKADDLEWCPEPESNRHDREVERF